jgi:RimJ/RimL family protein N-acetyltransferase
MQLPYGPAKPLRTERLLLRPFQQTDLEPLLIIHSDPEAVRHVPYPPRDRAKVAEVLTRKIANTTLAADGDLLELAVVRRGTDELIGDLLLALRSVEHQTLEVGYIFATAQAGHGYATEAVRALLGVAFDLVGARRVVARVDSRNDRSGRLLVRIGMRLEAQLIENEWFKGELSSESDYAILSREWKSTGPQDRQEC